MAYLGRGIENLSDRVVLDDITTSATATYNLTLNSVAFVPSSAESLTCSVNGVVQKCGGTNPSFTVSGSQIIFSSALTSSDSIDFIIAERGITLQTPSAGSVNTDQLAANAVTSGKMFSGFKNGITEADQWKTTGNTTTTADVDTFITANWSRNSNSSFNYIGTGITESSGVFSFPSTGIYLVNLGMVFARTGSTRYAENRIQATTDNSSYVIIAQSSSSISQVASSQTLQSGFTSSIIDVTDTSNVKVKVSCIADDAVVVVGNSSYNRTHITFIRLGDT